MIYQKKMAIFCCFFENCNISLTFIGYYVTIKHLKDVDMIKNKPTAEEIETKIMQILEDGIKKRKLTLLGWMII